MSAFTWRDGDRTIVYGEDAAGAVRRLGWDSDATLLTTPRADPHIMPALMVGEGQVPDLAAQLLPEAGGGRLLAWGGGRVIDTAKAIASVSGARVGAVPTTLSGAEMTSLHRKIEGREQGPSVRPVLVIGDPALMCSLPERALRASALNALAHGVEALYGPRANPVATIVALRGARGLSSASSPKKSPGPSTLSVAMSPNSVVTRAAKRPLWIRWSVSAGSPAWNTTSPASNLRRRARSSSRAASCSVAPSNSGPLVVTQHLLCRPFDSGSVARATDRTPAERKIDAR